MGVHGLWKLLEPSGQMVPLESLAGKVLAVDVSIWLHQAVKGMHDAHGAPVAVAHLLILFHRLCKLLFYKIKPVFVFDGGVPVLKRQTMAARRQQTSVAKTEAMKVREKLIKNLLKHEAVRQVLSNESASVALGLNSFALPGPSVEEDLYKLPPIAAHFDDSESSENVTSDDEDEEHHQDIHSIDVTSKEFLSLPPEVRHDILTELIDTRKQSSWKNLDAMPKQSDNFSDFQMNRLLKRRAVQTSLEEAGKEMGGKALSLKELESLLGDQGVLDPKTDLPGKRIAKDNTTRYMLVQKKDSDEKKSGKFDIMNHLEEVEWSSESDTDIIVGKSPKKTRPVEKSTEVKIETAFLSKQPKVKMTEELANILSVLDDENISSDVKEKVENFQNKVELIKPEDIKKEPIDIEIENKNRIESDTIKTEAKKEEEIDQTVKVKAEITLLSKQPKVIMTEELENILSVLDDEDTPSDVKIKVEKFQNKVSLIKPENIKKESQNVYEKAGDLEEITLEKESVEENENFERQIKYVDEKRSGTKKKEVVNEEAVAKEKANENNKMSEASESESENDFVEVDEEVSVIVEKEKKIDPSIGSLIKKPLFVTIDTAQTTENDDIFADVFESEKTELNKTEKKDEEVNEYKTEFEKPKTKEEFDYMKKSLEEEQLDLLREQGKQERHALNPTDQMYTEAQELLRLFGVPFIVAPMEAEAQCATLNLIGLTEGTITDDSDIWLFGGRVVYKNFFNQNKHVLEYRSEDIQKYFKLSREDMIKIALLVGSDYTVGLNGIGPVTAMEILASFQAPNQNLLDSLQKFKDWFTGKNKSGPPRASLKKKIKNTVIAPGFPNRAVAEAYLNPEVDDSKEPFSWAKPNLDMIRKYVKAKMGWSPEKCNELLGPVLKKLEENTNQFTMDKYFRIVQKTSLTEGSVSKRVENAIKRLGGDSLKETEDDPKPKRKRKPKEPQTSPKDEAESAPKELDNKNEKVKPPRKARKKEENEEEGVSQMKSVLTQETKTRLINQRLHQDVKVPQKEMAKKLQEERKKQAIEIYRTYKKGKNKKKVYAKPEANLSESSSEDN